MNREGAAFCDRCGTRLRDPHVASPPLGERIGAPAAERRSVTVLFVDAEGSTAIAERVGDEETYRLVQGCVTRMTDAVERCGGSVTQFRGDGIMALFGAPVALEHAALRAVDAALEMQAALEKYSAETQERLGVACRFRIGISTGPAVVGRVGDETLVDFTAIGDTANLAARLEQAADPGSILVAAPTWRAVRDYVECRDRGPLTVKGRSHSTHAWEVIARRPVTGRLDAAAGRGLSAFVGRRRELATLRLLVRDLAGGRGGVAVVAGEPGIGKSRLVRELCGTAGDVQVFEGRCDALASTTPWYAVADLLRRLLEIDEVDDAARVRERLDALSAGWTDAGRAAVPHLAWLLRLDAGDAASFDPLERRAAIVEAFRTLVRETAARRPVLVLVEDLHWADEATASLVGTLGADAEHEPLLVVVTYRSGHVPPLWDRAPVTHIGLDELSIAEAARLAGDVGARLTDDARQFVATRSGGNPLFVEELAAWLGETTSSGDARVDANDATGAVPVPDLIDGAQLPSTLHDVVLARVDRLDSATRQLLQVASVLGTEFAAELLGRVTGDGASTDDQLARLERLELVRRLDVGSYAFKHAVVRDVTYSTLLADRRRALHRRAAEILEAARPGAPPGLAELVAHHWLEAGDELRALDHLERAGDEAVAGCAIGAAQVSFDRALDIVERHGLAGRLVALAERRMHAALLGGDPAAAVVEADRMRTAAAAAGDRAAEATALARRGELEFFFEDFAASQATLREALTVGGDAGERGEPVDGLVTAAANLVIHHGGLGRHDEIPAIDRLVEPVLERARRDTVGIWFENRELFASWRADWRFTGSALARLDDIRSVVDRMWVLWISAIAEAGQGRYIDALGHLHEVVDVGRRVGEVQTTARALNTIGWIHGDLGDLTGAIRWNRECLDVIQPRTVWERKIEINARLNLADAHTAARDLDAAARELAPVERWVRSPEPPSPWMLWRFTQRFLCTAGELALLHDRPRDARAAAEECIDAAERTRSLKYVARGRRVRGIALDRLGARDEARRELDAALAVARTVGNPPQVWRTLLVLASVAGEADARRIGREAAAVIDGVVAQLGDHPLAVTLRASADRAAAATFSS